MLTGKLTKEEEEIKATLNHLHPDKALGSDGFAARFFQKCGYIPCEELVEAIEVVRNSGRFLREINNTFIALIPEKGMATSLDDFRPISLCNTLYKIMTKAMANRLKLILPRIISEE